MIRVLASALFLVVAFGCAKEPAHVVLYTSQDQFYAEPILADFTRATGIQVRSVFDTESIKTAGLANRLRAERSQPQCDVFWSNEEMYSRFLLRDGVLASNHWKTVGFRTRRIVINTNFVSLADAPRSLMELTERRWHNRVALAYPLYGTTSFHFLALRQHWGSAVWSEWCRGLVRNATKVVDGNSVVVKLVGAGEAWIGLTDSDDVAAAQRQGLPVMALPYVEESLVIPNTLALTQNAPRPEAALKLVDYLQRPETLQKLVSLGALEGIQPQGSKSLKIDWTDPQVNLEQMNETLKSIFLRS